MDIAGVKKVITGVDVTDNNCGAPLVAALGTTHIDVLINNAGYFYGPVETLSSLNFEEELKMIDICAVGPLRVTAALFNAGLLSNDAKVRFHFYVFFRIYMCMCLLPRWLSSLRKVEASRGAPLKIQQVRLYIPYLCMYVCIAIAQITGSST